MKWRRQPHVAWQMVADQAVLMNLASGQTIGLNPSASFIWARIVERTDAEIARELAERFRLEPSRAEAEVREFLDFLARNTFVAGEA